MISIRMAKMTLASTDTRASEVGYTNEAITYAMRYGAQARQASLLQEWRYRR